ncbi:MAG: hypothetical protein K0Q73_6079 [Paenibacillus sp.]|jgi:hypothetical protein|nr:hypothetical protein [Paenibacillus sp.]
MILREQHRIQLFEPLIQSRSRSDVMQSFKQVFVLLDVLEQQPPTIWGAYQVSVNMGTAPLFVYGGQKSA